MELAIVMTIIGLLIGGILKGQELMQNARVTSTIAQVRAYEAATTTFRDKYDALPGDMASAQTRIPNCGVAACTPNAGGATGTPGDGIVGANNWTGTAAAPVAPWPTQTAGAAAPAAPAAVGGETYLFWTHLLLSDLITGVTTGSLNAATYAFGETHPSAKIGGGFIVGYGSGGRTPGNATANAAGPSGLILALVNSPTAGAAAVGGSQVLTPGRTATIDRKMDDGKPDGGYVQSFGLAASCFGAAAPYAYQENVTTPDCGLVFRIQG